MNEVAFVEDGAKHQVSEQAQGSFPSITYTRDQLDLIKKTYASEATDDELALFVYASKRLSLDILARQIHFSKFKGKPVFIVSIDGYRLNAERTGKYAPGREPSFSYDKDGELISATAYVKKYIGGEWHECAATAFMAEYRPSNDEKAFMWDKMPHNQLAKCAEALVLRKAFPKDLGDTVTEDEMAQVREPEKTNPIPPPVAKQPTKPSEPQSDVVTHEFIPYKLTSKPTKKEGQTRYATETPDGNWPATFDDAEGKILKDAKEAKAFVVLSSKKEGDYWHIVSVKLR